MSDPEDDVIVKDAPADLAETLSQPGVPPSEFPVTYIRLLSVTAASETTTLPAMRVADPCLIRVNAVAPEPRVSLPVDRVIRNGIDSVDPASFPAVIWKSLPALLPLSAVLFAPILHRAEPAVRNRTSRKLAAEAVTSIREFAVASRPTRSQPRFVVDPEIDMFPDASEIHTGDCATLAT